MCYFFIPQNWNIPRINYQEGGEHDRYNPMDLVREGENLNKFKRAIIKGTRSFADKILQSDITDFPSIDKMGLLFFGRNEDLLKNNEIIYVPLSENEIRRSKQFDLLFPWYIGKESSNWDYDKYFGYLKKKEEKIRILLQEKRRRNLIWIPFGFEIIHFIFDIIQSLF